MNRSDSPQSVRVRLVAPEPEFARAPGVQSARLLWHMEAPLSGGQQASLDEALRRIEASRS